MNKEEQTFLNDKECRVIVSLGSKGSGKSTMLLNYLKYAITNKLFDEYHLILPAFSTAQDGKQYAFLDKRNDIYIYNKYSQLVSKKILNIAKSKKNKRIFYAIDDATSSGIDINKDQNLLEIITTTRHIKCQTWLLLHAARRVLSVPIRSNIDYLFLHNITNAKLLDAIHEEWFSRQFNKDQFTALFNEVSSIKYNSLFKNCINNTFDAETYLWNLNKMIDVDIKEKPKPKPKETKTNNLFSKIKF